MTSSSTFECTILDQQTDLADFHLTAKEIGLAEDVPIRVQQTCLHTGKEMGSRVLILTVGDTCIRLVPTRAMAILDVVHKGVFYGWESPVKEVVHPSFINLSASNGLGWLEGFNEMTARCGYQWTGHPGQDGDEFLTLHGRIQNIPANKISLRIERQAPYQIELIAQVHEKCFKSTNFELETRLVTCLSSSRVNGDDTEQAAFLEVKDTLTNKGAYETEYQVIYHNNFAGMLLEEGSKLLVPMAQISPFNHYAVSGLNEWNSMPAPTAYFDEMVFNIEPLSDEKGFSYALMHNKNADLGVLVSFASETLPRLTIWKNTDLKEQGYVVGIEPGTSFAYNRKYQRELDLVPKIGAGESIDFTMRFDFLTCHSKVQEQQVTLQALQAKQKVKVKNEPLVDLDA